MVLNTLLSPTSTASVMPASCRARMQDTHCTGEVTWSIMATRMSPPLHRQEGCLEIEYTGRSQGIELTNAVAGHQIGFDATIDQYGEEGRVAREHRRLGEAGIGQLLKRSLLAQRGQVVAE